MGVSETGIVGGVEFPSTSWSAICQLRDRGSPDYHVHLRRMVEQYWKPVYWVIRHSWSRGNADAKDLTQDFFADAILSGDLMRAFVPERGSFRSLVKTALIHFMANVVRDAGRQKRGGHVETLSLDAGDATLAEFIPDAAARTPAEIFDAAWNHHVMDQAVTRLRARLAADGRTAAFDVFLRYDLDGDRAKASYAEVGRELGLSADQVKHALAHARDAFRDIVTEIVRGYVDRPEDLARELRELFGAS